MRVVLRWDLSALLTMAASDVAMGSASFDPFAPLGGEEPGCDGLIPVEAVEAAYTASASRSEALKRDVVTVDSDAECCEGPEFRPGEILEPLYPATEEFSGHCVQNADVLIVVASRLISILQKKSKRIKKHFIRIF